MKVNMPMLWKELYTVADARRARAVIKFEKDDTSTPTDYGRIAARAIAAAHGWEVRFIITAEATTAVNYDMVEPNRYGDDTGVMDVEIDVYFRTYSGIIHAWPMLSDIWDYSPGGELPDSFRRIESFQG